MLKNITAVVFSVVMMTPFCYAKELPSPTDLKAMYCLKVVQNQIGTFSGFLESAPAGVDNTTLQETVAELRDDEERIRSYLLPRGGSLDSAPLLIAARRAERDIQSSESKMGQCTAAFTQECKQAPNFEDHKACMQKCMDKDDAGQRIRSCRDKSWMPF